MAKAPFSTGTSTPQEWPQSVPVIAKALAVDFSVAVVIIRHGWDPAVNQCDTRNVVG